MAGKAKNLCQLAIAFPHRIKFANYHQPVIALIEILFNLGELLLKRLVMKKLLLICLIMAAFQSFSQECGNYYFLQNNKTVEMTIYNQKGVADGKLVYSMSDVKTSGGVTTAQVQSVILDKKGKTIGKGISEMKCSGGRMMVNMQMMIPQSQTEMFKAAC